MSFCLNVPVPPRSSCCQALLPAEEVPVRPPLRLPGSPPSTELDPPAQAVCPRCGRPCSFFW